MTASGFEYDKELSRISIKVFPALQALIANQHDLIEAYQKYAPEQSIFLDSHRAELMEVEEIIAKEHAKHFAKKEELKKKRQEKKLNQVPSPANETEDTQQGYQEYNEPLKEMEAALDEMVCSMSPGLPSARFAAATPKTTLKQEETDIRRIAIGASIKALETFIGRELTEQEMAVIESQVDSYL
ncbi:MAG: hypothetical protein A4E53_02751 [Pelotomaculum sp. PtaB.Bin104]|nr:MAG: hypothetical protein A4E53_02751 [Pelotomaculum sp. PtaB.Bin104]